MGVCAAWGSSIPRIKIEQASHPCAGSHHPGAASVPSLPSYRDKRTKDFAAAGKRVKAFSGLDLSGPLG
jgi:hypothetical protein